MSPTAVQAHAQHATVQIGRERRRSSISPVAVKSREEYSSRRRQSLAHALGEYEDEEQQEQQEQQVQQEQVKPEPEDALIKDANNKNSKKSEHAGNHVYSFVKLRATVLPLQCPFDWHHHQPD